MKKIISSEIIRGFQSYVRASNFVFELPPSRFVSFKRDPGVIYDSIMSVITISFSLKSSLHNNSTKTEKYMLAVLCNNGIQWKYKSEAHAVKD